MSDPAYCPYYCEENIWWLAADPRVGEGTRRVLVVSNRQRRVALWRQRAGSAEHGGLVVWDYHVVLTCGREVWDLDSDLGAPVSLRTYLPETFRGAPAPFEPTFRVIEASRYREVFASDRSHMRGPDGALQRPPPSWPPIGQGHTLEQLLDFDQPQPGEVVDLPGLVTALLT